MGTPRKLYPEAGGSAAKAPRLRGCTLPCFAFILPVVIAESIHPKFGHSLDLSLIHI